MPEPAGYSCRVTGPLLDPGRPFDAHIAARLDAERVIWLASVRPDGRPHQVPVWFLWQDPAVLVFSLPGTQKVGNVRARPAVTLCLDSADGGSDVVIADGDAELVGDPGVRATMTPFAAKYAPLIGADGLEQWAATFSQPIRVRVSRIMAWRRTPEGVQRRVVTAS